MDLIEPSEDEEYVLGYILTGDDVTLESGVHRFLERLLKVITVCEPVVLVTKVVEVLDRMIHYLIETDGVVGTVGEDHCAVYQEVTFPVLGELLHPDVLGSYVIIPEVEVLVEVSPVEGLKCMICHGLRRGILIQVTLDDVAAFNALLNDVRVFQDLVFRLLGPGPVCICLHLGLLPGLGQLGIVHHNVEDLLERLIPDLLILKLEDTHQTELEYLHRFLGVVPEL